MEEEIKYLQGKVSACVEDVLEKSMDLKRESFKDLNKCLDEHKKLELFYKPIISKSAYSNRENSRDFIAKVENTYSSMGRYGYSSLACRSFALNYNNHEVRSHPILYSISPTENFSNYYYGLYSKTPKNIDEELNYKKNLEYKKSIESIKLGIIPPKSKNKKDLFEKHLYLNNLANPNVMQY